MTEKAPVVAPDSEEARQQTEDILPHCGPVTDKPALFYIKCETSTGVRYIKVTSGDS